MSTNSRDKVLASIRAALGDGKHLPVLHPHGPSTATENADLTGDRGPAAADLVPIFAAELKSLSGQFIEMPVDEVEEWLVAWLRERRVGNLLSWEQAHLPVPGLLDGLRRAKVEVTTSELPRDKAGRGAALEQWERIKVGLTGADAALAETGTLVLRSGPGRPRLASLSVATHVAFVTADQFHASWAAWLKDSGPGGAGAWVAEASSVSLVSGPSRTADIEMTLTVGVHGPGEVLVVLVTGALKP